MFVSTMTVPSSVFSLPLSVASDSALLSHPATLLALFLLLHHGLRQFSFAIPQMHWGFTTALRVTVLVFISQTETSVPWRERGEGSRHQFLPWLQWLLSLLQADTTEETYSGHFQSFLGAPSEVPGKSLQENRLPLYRGPRGFTQSCQ